MATKNPAPSAADVIAGAEDLRQVLIRIGTISNKTYARRAGRDYRAIVAELDAVLRMRLGGDDRARTEGFMRALADLMCRTADRFGTDPNDWDPISETATSFRASSPA